MSTRSKLNASRRSFLKAGFATGTLPFAGAVRAEEKQSTWEVKRYAPLGRTGYEISDISFGSSRLRQGEEDIVLHALDRGINHIDTAESYTRSASETVIGNALKGKRDQVVITSKVIAGADTSADSFMASLEGSLKRLRTDYVDIYMSHAVNKIEVLKNPEWHAFIDKAKEQGKIRFSGMSGHAGRLVDCLNYALDEDMVDVVLVAHNFGQDPKFYEGITRSFDFVATQQGLPPVLARAKEQDVGVIAMKTLMGARLNDMRPYEKGNATFAQAAFRWVLSNPNVDALIVTMTSQDMVNEYLGASGWQETAYGDMELLEQYARLNGTSYCQQACNDCAGACPYQVSIPDVLRTRMYATDYQDLAFARDEYAMIASVNNAEACLTCTAEPCQGACTHGIPIHELCGPTHQLLA